MEEKDVSLIRQLVETNEELAGLWRDHQEMEARLDNLNGRVYLTNEEQLERKRLQKIKLAGRDRMEAILAEYRQAQ